jgi:hypothetical protein
MSDMLPRGGGWSELAALLGIGVTATVVRLASDPPRTIARIAWQATVGVSLSTGGWIAARAAGLEDYPAFLVAWVVGASGSDFTLALARRMLEGRGLIAPVTPPPEPPKS